MSIVKGGLWAAAFDLERASRSRSGGLTSPERERRLLHPPSLTLRAGRGRYTFPKSALAEPGAVYVVQRKGCHETNLPTTFEKIVYRAGLLPWAKPFQNMRASRETELAQTYPLHAVTAWIGNSARIAAKHYLQVTDADFERATGRRRADDAQNDAVRSRRG